jgi:osmotically-inducible protein OsmY
METDTALQQDIIAELKWERSLDSTKIGASIEHGVVNLAGHVASFGEKWSAKRAAQPVSRVKRLAIEIEVKLTGDSTRDDGDIARTAKNVFESTSNLPNDAIKVMVEDGWAERNLARNSAWSTPGVRKVVDNITVSY